MAMIIILILQENQMKKVKVSSQQFPTQKYQLIETVSKKNKHNVAKYKNLEDQSEYLFHEYSFRSLPDKIRRRIVRQLQDYSQYALKGITVADEVYIFESKERVKISMRTIIQKNRALSYFIKAKKYTVNPQAITQQMINLSLLTHRMHQNNHAHGALQLSNIYCSNERLTLGKPKYSQIEKWANAQISIDDQAAQQSVSEAEDVWSIGFCFLQMVLNKVIVGNVNKQTVCKEYLPRVANPNFRHVLSVMLRRGGESVGILGVMGMLSNITNKDQFVFGPIPKHEECASLRFTAFKDQPYRPAKALNIVKSIKREVKGCEMNFILGNNSVMCIVTGKVVDFAIEMTEKLNNYTKVYKWLRVYLFQKLLEDQRTIITLSQQGFIQININPKIGMQLKQKLCRNLSCSSFNNVCHIQGEKQRKGLILTQRIVITPTCNLQELKRNESRLSFECQLLNRCTSEEYECFFAEEELQSSKKSKGAQLQYCAIDFLPTITLAYFGNYLKLIKNYDEAVIEGKVDEAEDADVYFNYQLGPRLLTKGDIVFKKDAFVLANADGLLSGEPLRLNLSYNSQVSCAVIGLYVEKGAGILFNDQFYRSIYAIIGKIRTINEIRRTYLPFIFIDCKAFSLDEGQLACINSMSLSEYAFKNKLSKNTVLQTIRNLQKDETQNLKELGFYHYLIFKLFCQNDPQVDSFYLKRADYFYSQYYPRPNIINAVVKTHLMSQIKRVRNNLFLMLTNYKQISDQSNKCIDILTTHHHNPFLQIQALKIYPHSLEEPQILQKLNEIYNEFQLYNLWAQINTQLLNFYKNDPKQQIKVHSQEEFLKDINEKRFNLKLPFNDIQRKIRRTKKYAQSLRFEITNNSIEELFVRQQSQVPLSQQKQKKLTQLWKSTIVLFMASCTNLSELLQFQRITKQYYQEGYVHTRDFFRKKQVQLEKSQIKQVNQ